MTAVFGLLRSYLVGQPQHRFAIPNHHYWDAFSSELDSELPYKTPANDSSWGRYAARQTATVDHSTQMAWSSFSITQDLLSGRQSH
jgi:hypothetical protein